jgi:pheromone shutdown protein TraB
MIKRRRSRNTTLEEVLADEAQRLQRETQGIQPGYKKERLVRKARQAEAAFHMVDRITSPGLQPPK